MITIYTKDFCPYCTRAKQLFDSEGIKYQEIDITDKPDTISELVKKSGIMTVPQIFVDDQFVGDCSQMYALHEAGELHSKLGQ